MMTSQSVRRWKEASPSGFRISAEANERASRGESAEDRACEIFSNHRLCSVSRLHFAPRPLVGLVVAKRLSESGKASAEVHSLDASFASAGTPRSLPHSHPRAEESRAHGMKDRIKQL